MTDIRMPCGCERHLDGTGCSDLNPLMPMRLSDVLLANLIEYHARIAQTADVRVYFNTLAALLELLDRRAKEKGPRRGPVVEAG